VPLKLVLFIDGEPTYEEYPYPLEAGVQITDPEEVYRRMYAYSKSDNPNRDTPPFTHEYKILWSDV